MICSTCKIDLHKRTIEGIEVDECEKCEGIWFEAEELRQVKDKIDADLNWMDFEIWEHPEKFKALSKTHSCPSCVGQMYLLDYDNTQVEIEYCAKCRGIWLAKDKLQNIVDALEAEILTKSMGGYVKATIEEAKELLVGPETFLSEWNDFTTILRFLQYRILSAAPKIHETLVSFQQNPLNR